MASVRRLSAIMFTDTVGYTASTQADEGTALELLRQQQELIRPLLKIHQGREIKSTGDGFLVEFDSALKATQCAVNIQRRIFERSAEAGMAPIQIRIGIHLGDVVQRGTDILGDAVNIAARIEPIAEPGGVAISGAVYDQIRNKISERLEKLPPIELKGLETRIEIYRVALPWTVRISAAPGAGPTRLAVLPFANISPDPKDEYFADGLTEEMITVLSQVRALRVIARTSVSQYKSTNKSVAQIGAELGVDAVLEGSVRKAGDELRITVQLIDVDTQEHAWARTYDRKLEKVFVVQAEIAKEVAEALKVELRATEESRLESRPTVRPDSYLAYMKALTILHTYSRASLQAAKAHFELAISLDPNNAAAYAGLANATRRLGIWFTDDSQRDWLDISERLVRRAIEIDPNLAEAHSSLAFLLFKQYDWSGAEKEYELAQSLDPSAAETHNLYAQALANKARADDAVVQYKLAEAADPLWPTNLLLFARLLAWLGRVDEALVRIQKVGELNPGSHDYHYARFECYLASGDLQGALKELNSSVELEAEPRVKPIHRAMYYALSGESEKSRALLRHEERLPLFGQIPVYVAWIYAELGDLDETFRWLEKAFLSHNLPISEFQLDPRLAHVRADPRFQALLRKMNFA